VINWKGLTDTVIGSYLNKVMAIYKPTPTKERFRSLRDCKSMNEMLGLDEQGLPFSNLESD